jgi:ribonuclease R
VLGADGKVERIERRQRLDSHKLIEEFMIAANVAAAETLEQQRLPCMYRVHDAPSPAKVDALREFLDGLEEAGLHLAKGQALRPRHFNHLLAAAAGSEYGPVINELVLRSQAQAAYSPENLGHFGLALRRYAHFTSPIRRYADLLVHRALIAGHNAAGDAFGAGDLPEVSREAFAELGAHISQTERRAAAAERSALDRYTVAFVADRVGASFAGRVNGVTRFGLFVTLDDSGADGLIPISTLPDDFYVHEEAHHRLVGRRHGRVFRLGDRVTVRLAEANPVTGGLVLTLLDGGSDRSASRRRPQGTGPRHPRSHPDRTPRQKARRRR